MWSKVFEVLVDVLRAVTCQRLSEGRGTGPVGTDARRRPRR